ncbi:hypothetical protein SUGI_0246500 [Cryptomeria japonica]|nr:hypothetical protein SUGI_0246500 [Cryptomeria japonica]
MDSGYKTLIPDLYRGKVGLDVAEAKHLMDGLYWIGDVKDIKASAKWLKENGSKKLVAFILFVFSSSLPFNFRVESVGTNIKVNRQTIIIVSILTTSIWVLLMRAAIHAEKGIFVSASTRNSGMPNIATNVAPWIFTVAASSIDKSFKSDGEAVNPITQNGFAGLVLASNCATPSVSQTNASFMTGEHTGSHKRGPKICFTTWFLRPLTTYARSRGENSHVRKPNNQSHQVVSMKRSYRNMMNCLLHKMIPLSFLNLDRKPSLNFSKWETRIMTRVFNVMNNPQPQLE